jgi:hypothetical protein
MAAEHPKPLPSKTTLNPFNLKHGRARQANAPHAQLRQHFDHSCTILDEGLQSQHPSATSSTLLAPDKM